MPVGLDNLILVDEETQERTFKVGSQGGGGADTSGRKWRCGELEWDALMRTLDNSVSPDLFIGEELCVRLPVAVTLKRVWLSTTTKKKKKGGGVGGGGVS